MLSFDNSECFSSVCYLLGMGMDYIRERRRIQLQALVDKFGGKAAFGRAAGYESGAYVAQMLSGMRPITEKAIERFERLPGARGWFAETNAPMSAHETTPYLPGFEHISVPVLAQAGSMGAGSDQLHDDVVVGRLTLSPQWIQRTIKPSAMENLRFIHGYGDSMESTFSDGDVLLVDAGVRDVKIDGIYVLEAQDRLFIKRVTQSMNGGYQISSDNPAVKTVDVLDGSSPVAVLGRVLWAWNGKKL